MTRSHLPAKTVSSPSRRQILKRAAAAAAGAMAAPMFIPSSALGKDGATAPSERIVMAGIGIGGRGSHDLNWALSESDTQFVAICDVSAPAREKAKGTIDKKNGNADCKTYRDVREFLAQRTDIDAVICATSERWHSMMSIIAMRAGRDIYCEKPGSMFITEGRAMMETAKRYGRVFQTGTQRRSEANFIFANELAKRGYLGKLHTVYAHTLEIPLNHDWAPAEPEPAKEVFDWNLWLGPVPWRPYNKKWIHGWHGVYDFHTGGIGEWGSHTINQCQMAIGADHTAAIEYKFPGNDTGNGLEARFANGIKLVLNGEGWSKPGRKQMWHGSCGVRYEGSEGSVSVADGYSTPELSNPALLSEFKKLVNEYLERENRPLGHMRDFLNCVKSRRLTVSNASVSHHTMSTNHAANICTWLKRDLKYDPIKEEFLNDPEANRLRTRAWRDPWSA